MLVMNIEFSYTYIRRIKKYIKEWKKTIFERGEEGNGEGKRRKRECRRESRLEGNSS